MKMKAKRLSLLMVMVLGVVLACICFVTACGGSSKKDYSAYTYTQYAKEDWDSKTISYQMYSVGAVSGPGTNVHFLANLYADGGVAVYEFGLWAVSNDDAHAPYDYENNIAYAWFGQWEADGDTILVRVLGEDAGSRTIDMSAATFETMNTDVPPGTPVENNAAQFKIDISSSNLYENSYYKFTGGQEVDGDNTYALYWGDSEKIKGPVWHENEATDELSGNEYMAVVTTPVYKTLADWVSVCKELL